jgi:hypothetical protein
MKKSKTLKKRIATLSIFSILAVTFSCNRDIETIDDRDIQSRFQNISSDSLMNYISERPIYGSKIYCSGNCDFPTNPALVICTVEDIGSDLVKCSCADCRLHVDGIFGDYDDLDPEREIRMEEFLSLIEFPAHQWDSVFVNYHENASVFLGYYTDNVGKTNTFMVFDLINSFRGPTAPTSAVCYPAPGCPNQSDCYVIFSRALRKYSCSCQYCELEIDN